MHIDTRGTKQMLSVFLSTDSFHFSQGDKYYRKSLEYIHHLSWEHMPTSALEISLDEAAHQGITLEHIDQLHVVFGDLPHNISGITDSKPSLQYDLPEKIEKYWLNKYLSTETDLEFSLLHEHLAYFLSHLDFETSLILYVKGHTLFFVGLINDRIALSNFFHVEKIIDVYYYFKMITQSFGGVDTDFELFIGGDLERNDSFSTFLDSVGYSDFNRLSTYEELLLNLRPEMAFLFLS